MSFFVGGFVCVTSCVCLRVTDPVFSFFECLFGPTLETAVLIVSHGVRRDQVILAELASLERTAFSKFKQPQEQMGMTI